VSVTLFVMQRCGMCLIMSGLGFKGDVVSVSKRLARNHMFPASVAEYLTEENLKKYEEIRKVTVYLDCAIIYAVYYLALYYCSFSV